MSDGINSYRDLKVWQRGMDLCATIYKLTQKFPADERFGLTAQLRRGSVAIPSNIAEGYGRMHTGDYRRLLTMAFGSLMQVETQLLLAERFGLVEVKEALDQCDQLGRMLNKLISKIYLVPSA